MDGQGRTATGQPQQPAQQPSDLGHGQWDEFSHGDLSPFTVATGGIGPDYRQKGMGQHGQGDVPAPADPQAHLILIQPHLLFGLLEDIFDDPPGAFGPAPNRVVSATNPNRSGVARDDAV